MESEQGYWAYGRYRTGGTLPTDHKFTGQKLDGSGLYYYNARYYDPELGIFVSPDTLVPDVAVLVDYNRYAYARANPLLYNDPTGHEPHDANNPCSYQVCIKDPVVGGWVKATAWSPEVYQRYYGSNSWLAQEPLTIEETHQVLDAVGVVDPTGISDGANAALYALEGDGVNAGISTLAILPLGDIAKAGKYADEAYAATARGVDELYGPFHRLESSTQTAEVARLQEASGEIWGGDPRWGTTPKVQAYDGSLPTNARGIEFYTDVAPDVGTPPHRAYWSGPRPGVRVEDGYAKICCTITRNTQK